MQREFDDVVRGDDVIASAPVPKQRGYLELPLQARSFGLAALFISANVYSIITNPKPYPLSIFVALLQILAAIAVLFSRPRTLVYVLLLAALILHVFSFTQIVARGEQDAASTRDDSVELTVKSLISGNNAWNANPVGAQATTGPTSILLAIPFVILFGDIQWLSFLFWILFSLVLLWYDLREKNDTWPFLILIIMLGAIYFEHTMYWSLEELYYPILFFVLATLFAARGQTSGIGVLLAAAVLSRPNYMFLAIGFGTWFIFRYSPNRRDILRIAGGIVVAGALILLPFIAIGGKDMFSHNPWTLAADFSSANWPDNNFVFTALNEIANGAGMNISRAVRLVAATLLILIIGWRLSLAKISHPFWHLSVAGFIAHTVFWLNASPWSNDYALIFILPGILAIAHTAVMSSPIADQAG